VNSITMNAELAEHAEMIFLCELSGLAFLVMPQR